MQEEETGGISIGDIFRTIYLKKWIVLIVAVVITLAGTLAIQLGYNDMVKTYKAEFTYLLPGGVTGNAAYDFPDGTRFYFTDIVSYDNLLQAQGTRDEFKGVKVEAMSKGGVKIERTYEIVENEITESKFTVTASAKFFNDAEQAKMFIYELVRVPVNYFATMKLDCDVSLSLSRKAEDFESEIELLSSQTDYIKSGYDSLISSYGGSFVVDGKTLSSYRNEIIAYQNNNTLDVLVTKVKTEGLLKKGETLSKYEMKKNDIERRLRIAETTLETLKNSVSSEPGSGSALVEASVIKTQSDLVENLRLQLEDMNNYIEHSTVDTDDSFRSAYIDPEYEKIAVFTDLYEHVTSSVYINASTASFKDANVITTEGGFGLLTSLILSVVVGLILSHILGYILGYVQLKKPDGKEKEAVGAEEETPVSKE